MNLKTSRKKIKESCKAESSLPGNVQEGKPSGLFEKRNVQKRAYLPEPKVNQKKK